MIYVTGDCHAQFHKFNTTCFPEQKDMTKDDVMIVCGDFGGIWHQNENNKTEKWWLNWLNDLPFTVCFVDGNHENFDRLNQFPIVEHFGNPVHEIKPSVLHLMRGYCYNIQNKKIFTFGGAHSHDIDDGILELEDSRIKTWEKDDSKFFRVNHLSWWTEESPSEEERQRGLQTLKNLNHEVDFIITHMPPSEAMLQLNCTTDDISNYLQHIANTTKYTKWFCGHMHDNKYFTSSNVQLLYDGILSIA